MSDPPRIIGRYALYGKIASGGMATVHLGRLLGPVGFSRTVAIKRMHPHFTEDPEFVSMFLDEARLAARVRHPNVVPTLDVVTTEGELFLVMEYVQGETLARLLRLTKAKELRIPMPIVGAIFSGVLHGLHAAHEAKNERGEPLGIVHRDVSPQNLIIGLDGVPRVLDFGVAKAAGRLQSTRDGQLKGKISYMAPEQVRGKAATRQTDIYAVSVVLWETLTGKRLFQDENEAAVLHHVVEGDVHPPSTLVPEVPAAFDAIVMRGMNRDVDKRFRTAREMAAAIETELRLAIPVQVGEWVDETAGAALASQAARVAEIESASDASVAGVPEATMAQPPAKAPVRSVAASPAALLVTASADDARPPSPDFPMSDQTLVADQPPVAEAPRVAPPPPISKPLPVWPPPVADGAALSEPPPEKSATSGMSQMSSISVATPHDGEALPDRRRATRLVVGAVVGACALLGMVGLIIRATHGAPSAEVGSAVQPTEPQITAALPPAPAPAPAPQPATAVSVPPVSSAPEVSSVQAPPVLATAGSRKTSSPPPQTRPPATTRPASTSPSLLQPVQPRAQPAASAAPAPAPSNRPKSNILFTNPG
jgi:eukaryotic-like serine/threonine-protein kinase